jgi:predicted DNA-binding transcriptional regulator AlpA
MAEPESQRRGDREADDEKLFTLSEIAQKTKISMPTLQRYKKLYQNRIPAVGSGRKQRYPESAIPVFNEIKGENIGRRGRPRKDASEAGTRRVAGRRAGRPAATAAPRGRATPARRGRPPAVRPAGRPAGRAGAGRGARRTPGNLLTLTQVSEMTGISYPTLVRYVRLYSDRLPHEGKGRARRFHPEAVEVFRELRQQSGRGGRKPGSGGGRAAANGAGNSALAGRLRAIEKSHQGLEKRFKSFVKSLQKLLR